MAESSTKANDTPSKKFVLIAVAIGGLISWGLGNFASIRDILRSQEDIKIINAYAVFPDQEVTYQDVLLGDKQSSERVLRAGDYELKFQIYNGSSRPASLVDLSVMTQNFDPSMNVSFGLNRIIYKEREYQPEDFALSIEADSIETVSLFVDGLYRLPEIDCEDYIVLKEPRLGPFTDVNTLLNRCSSAPPIARGRAPAPPELTVYFTSVQQTVITHSMPFPW